MPARGTIVGYWEMARKNFLQGKVNPLLLSKDGKGDNSQIRASATVRRSSNGLKPRVRRSGIGSNSGTLLCSPQHADHQVRPYSIQFSPRHAFIPVDANPLVSGPPSSRVRDKGISPPPTSSPMRMQQSSTVTSRLPEPSTSPPSFVKMACWLQTRLKSPANQRTKSTKWTHPRHPWRRNPRRLSDGATDKVYLGLLAAPYKASLAQLGTGCGPMMTVSFPEPV